MEYYKFPNQEKQKTTHNLIEVNLLINRYEKEIMKTESLRHITEITQMVFISEIKVGNTDPARCFKQTNNNNNSDNFKEWILYNQSQKIIK